MSVSVLLVRINRIVNGHFLDLEELDLVFLVLCAQFLTDGLGELDLVPRLQLLKMLLNRPLVELNELNLELDLFYFLLRLLALLSSLPLVVVPRYGRPQTVHIAALPCSHISIN